MSKVVLKDKKDIRHCPASFLKDYEWESHGQYDSLDFVNPDVKVLSVQFTKVGEKTYKAFPNLEWIIIRQHGFNNVNIEQCIKRGIGVVTTKPFAQSTADWINSHIEETDNVALIGCGSIGSKVKANNIHFSYGNLKVLKGIDLHIQKGEFVSIVGASGSGKTTLLQLLGTLDKLSVGDLVINSKQINKLDDWALSKFRNKEIGFVFQFHNLLVEFTALENVCLPAFIAGKRKKQKLTQKG